MPYAVLNSIKIMRGQSSIVVELDFLIFFVTEVTLWSPTVGSEGWNSANLE